MNIQKIVLSYLLLAGSLSIYGQNNPAYSPAVKKRIHAVENNLVSWVRINSATNFNIYQRMRDLNVNGAVVAVIKDYKIDWVKAYGWADTAQKRRMTVNTLMQPASIGKSINAMGCLKLVQDGQVDLQTDINRYLKRWTFPYDSVSKGKVITLANLLSHTGGLTVHGFDGYEWNAPLPTILQTLNGEHPANNPAVRSEKEPGLEFQYSGGGITISEMLLEDVTHSDYEKYMRKNIFAPLQMTRTSFTTDPMDSNYATAYRFDGQSMNGKYMKFIERACGAALWTTASDLARFVIEIQLSVKAQSNKILNQAFTRRMVTPYLPPSNSAFGCFIDKKGDNTWFQHSGLNPGYCSQYFGSMENGNGVIVLVNSDMTDFMGEVVNAVASVYHWKDFNQYVVKKVVPLPADSLKAYTGKYVFEKDTTGPVIIYENGRLFLKDPHSTIRWNMYFSSAREFFMIEAKWANQQFFVDDRNRVRGFYILGDGYKITVNKVD